VRELPPIPIIVPLIVTGAFIGRVWPSLELKGMWRKTILTAAVSGLLNSAYSWVLGYLGLSGSSLAQRVGTTIPSATNTVATTTNTIISIISSGLFGFLVVIIVFLSAALMIRHRRGRELESEEPEE